MDGPVGAAVTDDRTRRELEAISDLLSRARKVLVAGTGVIIFSSEPV